ncbi:MAG: flavodoxin [Firmicutes bacterium]|nr:flavodoxin [Bacillota bacterium]
MKTIVIYYSFGGSTKAEAERVAAENDAVLCRVEETKDRSLFSTFVQGAPNAKYRKASEIKKIDQDLNLFDRIVIGCPVWGGYPAPAFNAIAELLPSGKEVELFFCSSGGETPKSSQGTKDLISKKGCRVISYRDVKTGKSPGKAKD